MTQSFKEKVNNYSYPINIIENKMNDWGLKHEYFLKFNNQQQMNFSACLASLFYTKGFSTALQQTPFTGCRKFVVCIVGRSRMCRDASWVIAVCSGSGIKTVRSLFFMLSICNACISNKREARASLNIPLWMKKHWWSSLIRRAAVRGQILFTLVSLNRIIETLSLWYKKTKSSSVDAL